MTKEIPLTKGKVALVDDEDFALVDGHKWHVTGIENETFYAQANIGGKLVKMHRLITGAPSGQDVDHSNHNGLDNRRANLRVCSHQQNISRRRKLATAASPYKGVRKNGNRWAARIEPRGKALFLGTFDNEIDAAKAYDQAARQHFGPYALTNFPE